jgi:hypothetical protein
VRRLRKIMVITSAAGLMLAAGLMITAGAASAATCTPSANTACAGVSVSIPIQPITLTLSQSSLTLANVGTGDYNATQDEVWTATSNDEAGYALSTLDASGTGAFVNASNANDTIPDSDLIIQTTVNGGATTSIDGIGLEYTSPGPSLPTGDVGSDLWLLRTGNAYVANGNYSQSFIYEAIQN